MWSAIFCIYLYIINLCQLIIVYSSRLKMASFVISSVIIHYVFYKSKAISIEREHPIWTTWSSLIFTNVPVTFMAFYEFNWSVFHITTITSVAIRPNIWKNVIWIFCISVLRILPLLFAFTNWILWKTLNIWSTAITSIIITFRYIDILITCSFTNCMFKSWTIC